MEYTITRAEELKKRFLPSGIWVRESDTLFEYGWNLIQELDETGGIKKSIYGTGQAVCMSLLIIQYQKLSITCQRQRWPAP